MLEPKDKRIELETPRVQRCINESSGEQRCIRYGAGCGADFCALRNMLKTGPLFLGENGTPQTSLMAEREKGKAHKHGRIMLLLFRAGAGLREPKMLKELNFWSK